MRQDIVEAYLKHNKLAVLEGEIVTDGVFMPFLLMDLAYQVYEKHIKPTKMMHKKNHLKKEWLRAYGKFNHKFFSAFTEEQTWEIVDKMDYLEEYVSEEMDVLRKELAKCLTDAKEDEKETCSYLLMMNIITQAAQTFWTLIYSSGGDFPPNQALLDMQKYSFDLIQLVYSGGLIIDCSSSPEAEKASSNLCQKVVHWSMVKSVEPRP